MDEITYWNKRYTDGKNSGDGSYGEQLKRKLDWLQGLDIHSISEIGCGDFNFGKHLLELYPNVGYIGQDISKVIIKRNSENYPNQTFTTEISELPPADLLLCVDVLFHVIDETEYDNLLKEIEKRWIKYLAITAYEHVANYKNHVRVRNFDYRRFGEPIIREIIEEDGQLYFYLFKKPTIDLSNVSCCLNTKESVYPQVILDHVSQFPFGEILIRTHSDSPYRKHELFKKAKYDIIYYQDDDAICPIAQLTELSQPDMINVAITQHHFEAYKNKRMTMGLGWGSFFPKRILNSLKKYTDLYGEDDIFKRDTEKILTEINYPQNRFILPIMNLPNAMAPDRLCWQPNHYPNMEIIEKRCKTLY